MQSSPSRNSAPYGATNEASIYLNSLGCVCIGWLLGLATYGSQPSPLVFEPSFGCTVALPTRYFIYMNKGPLLKKKIMCSLKKNSGNNLNLLSKFKSYALPSQGLCSQSSLYSGRPLMMNRKPFSNSAGSGQNVTKLHFVNLRFVGVGFRGYIIKKIIDVGALKGLPVKYLLHTTDLQPTDFLDESVKR